jgi:hypothetical protein
MSCSSRVIVLLLLVASIACRGITEAPPVEEAELRSPADTGTAAGAAPASPGRDLSGLDLCEVLPVGEVAEVTGRRLAGVASRQDLMESQGCTYGVTVIGGATPGRLSIWVQPPELYEGEEALLANAQGLGHEASVDPVTGLGDHAFMLANQTLGTHTLHLLREGDLSLIATAEDPQQAIAMAQLALARLDELAPAGLPPARAAGPIGPGDTEGEVSP